jgi:uncharacterized membrane protein YraQ (UPF0718 family)
VETILTGLFAGVRTTLEFFWQSLFGLIFGFLISAIVQVTLSRRDVHRFLGPGPRGLVNATGFGIVASACSYGAVAAARGFFQRGADLRAVFAFTISSTNMNLAILIMFWSLVGWKFAFAEFVGGIVIIAIVATGISLLFTSAELRGLADAMPTPPKPALVDECLQCGMEGDPEHAVEFEGTTYRFCGGRHEREFRADPAGVLGARELEDAEAAAPGLRALGRLPTWLEIRDVAIADVAMLRNELVVGFVVAGFAAALIPPAWISGALHAVGGVPVIGYALLLLAGLVLAALTFVCSMGNVPIARYLAIAGVPLGANTTFIYGDLLIPPLLAIYRKSFPPKATWSFIGLFVAGAMVAGALMDALLGRLPGGSAMPMDAGAMGFSDTFTLVSNIVALAALVGVIVVSRIAISVPARDAHDHSHGDHDHSHVDHDHSHGDHDHSHGDHDHASLAVAPLLPPPGGPV